MLQVDRRGTPRAPLYASAVFSHPNGVFRGICVDISAGGVGVLAGSPPEVGTIVEVALPFPDGRAILAKGEVARVRENSFVNLGVRFSSLDEGSNDRIGEYVNELLPHLRAGESGESGSP
ncbi:PilZ domain-containing protein [Myxococcota bacterium]